MMSEGVNQRDAAMNLATHSEGKETSVPNGDIRQNGTDNGHDTAGVRLFWGFFSFFFSHFNFKI